MSYETGNCWLGWQANGSVMVAEWWHNGTGMVVLFSGYSLDILPGLSGYPSASKAIPRQCLDNVQTIPRQRHYHLSRPKIAGAIPLQRRLW